MANGFKRSAVRATNLRSDIFLWARVKLTALYVLIIIIILTLFSLALYARFSERLRGDIDRGGFAISGNEENPAENALEKMGNDIITADLIILAIAGTLSYWLAGFTLKPIRTALEAQKEFSAEASHELRTPHTVMRTDIEVLLKGNAQLPDEAKTVLKSNLEEISTMSVMTEQLLELSRGGNPKTTAFERLDLKELAQSALAKFSKIAEIKKITVEFSAQDGISIYGQRQELARAFNNVLINALAFTPAGGKISVLISQKGKTVEIEIQDTGIGIPAKDLPHIFDPFYKVSRLDGAQKTATALDAGEKREGAGLGLALVKKIIEGHGGKVKISSNPGKGTKVYFFMRSS